MGDLERASQLFDLFSDADRLKIVGRLLEHHWTITGLADELNMKPQVVARHVRTLDEAGLIQRPEGQQLGPMSFDAASLREQVASIRPDEPAEFAVESNEDARILGSFIQNGRLARLPTQRSRWIVVLRWLADTFEPGRKYPEPEVNEILGAVHGDYALLRRQLVDEGFMARDHGIYWRVEDRPSTG